MQTRPLGATGIDVSEIGFGTWGLGGDSYGPVNDVQSVATLRHALDKGINFFDTAAFYGAGHAEHILHQAFGSERDRVVIASKVNLLSDNAADVSADETRAHVLSELDKSLDRLQTDYLDVYLMHSPDLSRTSAIDDAATVIQDLKEQGRIRAWGISARSPNDAFAAIERWAADVIEINFNVIDQRCAEIGLFDATKKANTGFICRTPLCFGYLTGTLKGASDDFQPLDHRASWPAGQLDMWAHSPRLFSRFYGPGSRTATQFALQFCLAEKTISTVIPGMLTCEQVNENVGAVDAPPLSADELSAVVAIYGENTFFNAGAKPKISSPGA